MEDKYFKRLLCYTKMISDYKTDDDWFYLDKNNDRISVSDFCNIFGDIMRDGITFEYQRDILNKLEKLYHKIYTK